MKLPCDFIVLLKRFLHESKACFHRCLYLYVEHENMMSYVCCRHVCMHMYIVIDMLCVVINECVYGKMNI